MRALPFFLMLVFAAPADASLAINKSIGGVRIGMTSAQVKAKLGTPDKKTLGPDFVNWVYARPAMEVTLKPDVITLFTKSRAQRGPGGIGVGTTEKRLRKVVRRARCQVLGGERLCIVGSFDTGKLSTVFGMTKGGRVRDITISLSTP
jgi:hypothetical protein